MPGRWLKPLTRRDPWVVKWYGRDAYTHEAATTTYSVGTATSLKLGTVETGTRFWRVRATDEHGMVGSWSAYDSFIVTRSGTAPVVTLAPLATSSDTTPLTTWTYVDADGDVITDYQVITASDAGFTADVVDTGIVASTAMYHQHAALAVGTWYRKVRIRTGTADWSAYVSDSFEITEGTTQTEEYQIYLDAEGTPTPLDQLTYPIEGLTITRRFDGPTEVKFTINNFDGTFGGIDEDEEMLIYVQDTDGNRKEFRAGGKGRITREAGLIAQITAWDISALFGRWQCMGTMDHKTLGEVIVSLFNGTGIICHVDECEDAETPGLPIRFVIWSGQGKTVASWLAEFQKMTGYRWYVDCVSGVWHFYWLNPESMPTWAVVLKDGIDAGAESSTQARLIDTPKVKSDWEGWANRIRYWALYEPYALPAGKATWDDVFTEDLSLWTSYGTSNVVMSLVDVDYQWGYHGPAITGSGVQFVCTYNEGEQLPQHIPLGYMKIPAAYRDFGNNLLGQLQWARYKHAVHPSGHPFGEPDIGVFLHSGSEVGPGGGRGVNSDVGKRDGYSPMWETRTDIWGGSHVWIHVKEVGEGVVDDDGFDANNVNCVEFRLRYSGWHSNDSIVPTGETWIITVILDQMTLVPEFRNVDAKTGQFYVETAAVTAGTELPVEAEIASTSMTQLGARALALKWLAIKSVARNTVSGLRLSGVRNVPMRSQISLVLTKGPVLTATYPLAQITWRAAERGGWYTDLVVGDMPSDDARAIEQLGHGFKNLQAEG